MFMRAIHLIAGFAVALVILTCCGPSPTMAAADHGKQSEGATAEIVLPAKTFAVLPDGSLYVTGHWKLKMWEGSAGNFTIAAQPLNSIILRCWPSKRVCEEYRASITKGIVFT